MANQPPSYPTNSNLNTPQSTSSQSGAPFTPRSSSFADDSDAEFDPTPLQSPRGGPDYDDLPPSYDEAQHQAVSDARNGVTPLDPSQIEAHRLTLNEGPDEPEIWEYRIRGEEVDAVEEHEQAPEYENFTNELGTNVPVQHVPNSDSIPVGRTGARNSTSNAIPISAASLVDRALDFTQQKPDADVQYAPRLMKRIAIPQQGKPQHYQENHERVQFLRAYAKALHAHSIQPAEFMAFLDGLNALCVASATNVDDLLNAAANKKATPGIVQDYLHGANEEFFAPRGLKLSLQSLSELVNALEIPTKRGQRASIVTRVLDHTSTVVQRAEGLRPWIDALETDVPAPSARSLMLREMAERLLAQTSEGRASNGQGASGSNHDHENEDPPHSIPDAPLEHHTTNHARPHGGRRHGRGRGGHRGGPRAPFGAPRHEHVGASGNGPFGPPGNGPFSRPGRGPFGGRGRGQGHGPPAFRHHRGADRAGGPAQATNEWAALGQNLGKWGEEFGKKMGDWGQQFGKDAAVWGQEVGNRANAWSGEMNARSSGSGSSSRPAVVSSQVDDTLPPSYDDGPSGQQSGIVRGDSKVSAGPPSYDHVSHGKRPAKAEKDDDSSSLSSDSSDSDSGSDSDDDDDDEDLEDTQATFLKRLKSIDKQAEESARKGKKSTEEIAEERALAIEKARDEKLAKDLKIEKKMSRRAMKYEHKQKRRDLKREYRDKKRDLKAVHTVRGKGKAKKTPEWKQARKEYRDKKKELRKEHLRIRKEWKGAESERTRSHDDGALQIEDQQEMERMVWVVIEHLDH